MIENKLIGIWGIIGEENSTFQISVDSIYYTDQDNDNVYKYIVKGDSLFIFYDGYTYKSIYNLFQDKLILTGSDGVDTFIKYTK